MFSKLFICLRRAGARRGVAKEGRLIEYRFFKINAAGLIDSGQRLRLIDDDAAMAHARALTEPRLVEVWSGKRRVGIVPPARSVQSA